MNRLRAFCKLENGMIVGIVLRGLLKYRSNLAHLKSLAPSVEQSVQELISKIEGSNTIASSDAFVSFEPSETLSETFASIEIDISADKPQAALDRLHKYCSKKIGFLLDKRSVSWDKTEPLHCRFGKYVKAVLGKNQLQEMSEQVLKSNISIYDKFNYVRNNHTPANDKELLSKAEARYIF